MNIFQNTEDFLPRLTKASAVTQKGFGGTLDTIKEPTRLEKFCWAQIDSRSNEDVICISGSNGRTCLGYVAEMQACKTHGRGFIYCIPKEVVDSFVKDEFGIYLNYDSLYLNKITPIVTAISKNWGLTYPTILLSPEMYGFAIVFDKTWFSKVWQIQAVMNLLRVVYFDRNLKSIRSTYNSEKFIWTHEATQPYGNMSTYNLSKYGKMFSLFEFKGDELLDRNATSIWTPEDSQSYGATHFAPQIFKDSFENLKRTAEITETIKFKPMYLKVKSRHPSHSVLRRVKNVDGTGIQVSVPTVMRLGSTTEMPEGYREINSIQAINNSADKLLMKTRFKEHNVETAKWWTINNNVAIPYNDADIDVLTLENLPYPIVAKHRFGSRGRGNTLLNSVEELQSWMRGKTLNNYIFEKFYNYNREYRLHIDVNGCFYTCRKVLRSDTPEGQRWFRNDSNSNWLIEENPEFDKPVNWDAIIAESVKALNAVGLDVGGVDVRIQSRTDSRDRARQNPEFIILEINSACSMAEGTTAKYKQQIPIILTNKYGQA